MLCAACVRMFQDLSKTGNHHHSYENLVKAAKSGCKICIYLQMLREERWSDETAETNQPFTTYSFTAWGSDDNYAAEFDTTIHSSASWFDHEVPLNSVTLKLNVSTPAPSPQWLPQFLAGVSGDLQTVPWNVRADGFDSRLIPESTGDSKVLELGLDWLETCINHHTLCEGIDETRQPGYYPSRLLEVGTSERDLVRLVQTAVEPPTKGSRYATLSHCWGQHVSFLRLTADNINSLTTEITLESLPRSFANAIVVCRRLRIRYLWIDSLCILQSGPGSVVDWQHHVRDMHVIYANCVLDLVIAHATNPEEGAFVTRNPMFIHTAHVYAPAKMGLHEPQAYVDRAMKRRATGDDKGRVDLASTLDPTHTEVDFALPLRDHTEQCLVTIFAPKYDWNSSLGDTPLWKRGWVFQELLMAPRILVFGKDRIYWQCHERMANEYLPHGLPGSGGIYDTHAKTPFTLTEIVLRSQPPSKLTDEELSKLHREWYLIVAHYSMTALTYPEKDKLAAIAAIAGRFDRVLPRRYCAGLFEDDLPIGLLWQTFNHARADTHWDMIERSLEVIFDSERSAEYRAPTWTWASEDKQTFHFPALRAQKNHRYQLSWSTLATIDEVSVEHKDHGNPYGQVNSGELVIRGVLVPLIHSLLEASVDHAGVDVSQDRDQELFALCIAEEMRYGDEDQHRTGPTFSVLYGIILSEVAGNTYQRKGYFSSEGPLNSSRFPADTYEEQTIIII
jgi:hypothetical protein